MAKDKKRKKMVWAFTALACAVLGAGIWLATPSEAAFKQANTWQRAASPGRLSAAHASLEADCAACHTPVKGVEPANCILCHANDATVLQRQETAFHARVQSCKECHPEHRGRGERPTTMDHVVLAKLGLRQLRRDDLQDEAKQTRQQLLMWLRHVDPSAMPHSRIQPEEMILNCVTCHRDEDPHVGYLGDDCAACHSTRQWTIPEYAHPPATTQDCAQCHKAPPSHFMPMFKSKCARMLGKSFDSVALCYVCHEISAWNDLKGAPWHKKTMSHIPSR